MALGTHNLVAWLAAVHQVRKEDGVLGAGQPARCHFAGTLLNPDALVVLVDSLHRTDTVSGVRVYILVGENYIPKKHLNILQQHIG